MRQTGNAQGRESLQPMHVVLIGLVIAVVGGSSLLLSAAESMEPVDGAIQWQEESVLRAVVRLLCLNYQFATTYAGDVKSTILGIGAGLALVVAGIAWGLRPVNEDELAGAERDEAEVRRERGGRFSLTPASAAQMLAVLYLLWSFASSRWSIAPELATGASILLAVYFLWSLCIGRGLNAAGAIAASRWIVAIAGVTAVVALWYYYGRNPTIRAKFPFGNPTFLSAGLMLGVFISLTLICERTAFFLAKRNAKNLLMVLLPVVVTAISLWAVVLTDSRGPAVGFGVGVLAVLFLAVRGRWKLAPMLLGVGFVVGVVLYMFARANAPSATGRSETFRLRLYSWTYAWQMFVEKPITGHGQGGFVLGGDARAVKDVLHDPLVFDSRIAHAHNEWLEVMADLGVVGVALIGATLVLTLLAGVGELRRLGGSHERWTVLGLIGAMVGLMVSECFGVGLRTPDVPASFYTGIGLIWAMARRHESGFLVGLQRNSITRLGGSVVLAFGGVAAMLSMQQDFSSARASYRVGQDLREEKFEEAAKDATLALGRLNPQRALENWYHLAEAYVSIAKEYHDRAMDREAKARQGDVPDPVLLELARRGRVDSDQYCQSAGAALKELIHRSPGYIHHGMIDFWANLIQSNNALSRGQSQEATRYLDSARAAAERELARQPYEPQVALAFARGQAGFAELPKLIGVLARPLRYHRMPSGYAELLRELVSQKSFSESFMAAVEVFDDELLNSGDEGKAFGNGKKPLSSNWAPEVKRLAAIVHYLQGNYEQAKQFAEAATELYERIVVKPSMGAAGCLEELADYTFVNQPRDAQQAIGYVLRGLKYAPRSEPGRAYERDVKNRLIEYHLATGNETAAAVLLRETGPLNVTDEAVQQEMGVRYRGMTQSQLLQRHGEGLVPKSAKDVLPEMQKWIQRAMTLNPGDGLAWYLAADLAFQEGNDQDTVHHLRESLRLGLPIEEAMQFLSLARDRRPDSATLNELWEALQSAINRQNANPTGQVQPGPMQSNSPGGGTDR